MPTFISVGALITVVGTFLPWLRSGTNDRNSFQLLSLLNFLGFAPEGPLGWAVRLWPLIPLVCVAAAVAAWRGMWPIAALCGVGGGAYAGGLAAAIRSASSTSLLQARWGTIVTMVGAALLVVTSLIHAARSMRVFEETPREPDEW
jgi:hypothetical protein